MVETSYSRTDIDLEEYIADGSNRYTGKGVAETGRGAGHVTVLVVSWTDVSAHGFWKRGVTAMFDV